MKILDLSVELREKLGSAEARRHRRAQRIPCILYGGPQDNVSLTTTRDQFSEILKGHTVLVRLHLGDQAQTAFVRHVEWDTFGEYVSHIDFQRVEPDEEVSFAIPLHFVGTPAGTSEGGRFERELDTLPVRGPLQNMPPEIRVDISPLQVGEGIRAGEVELPEGLMLDCDEQDLVAHVRVPRAATTAATGEEGAEAGEGAEGAAAGSSSGGDEES